MMRFLFSGALAAVVTAALLLLMHILIQTNIKPPEQGRRYKIPDIVLPQREITTEYDTSKPERPDELKETPPELPQVDFDVPEISNEGINISGPKIDRPTIAGPGGFGGDGEMIPITKIAAQYPSRALSRGLQGYCEVSFTVTEIGTTENVVVSDCPESVFERPSIKAAEKFKYKPRVVDGNPVKVPGVRNRFVFEMQTEGDK
jgi:protein TonB